MSSPTDGVAMGYPLGPTLANAFLVYHEENWLEYCPLEYRPLYYRTKLRKSLKGILNCCKLQIVFKSQNKLAKGLTSRVVYKFQCGFCNESYYGECVRHLNVRIGEHIAISSITEKKAKTKDSAVSDHLLLCNHSPSFQNFSVLNEENKKFLLELKESLLIMRYKPSLNRNIRSAPLYLFDKV